jgi:hypothetical protein
VERDWQKTLEGLYDGATVLRSRDLEQRGLSRIQIHAAAETGALERVGRGLYARAGAEPTEHHSLVLVARRVPHAAICLLSALRFHDLTTQNPHEVWIAIGPKDRKPSLEHPSIKVVRYGTERFDLGLEEHQVEATPIRVLLGGEDPGRSVQLSQQDRTGRGAGGTAGRMEIAEIHPGRDQSHCRILPDAQGHATLSGIPGVMKSEGLIASIRQRLLTLSRNNGETFDFVLARYRIERFLADEDLADVTIRIREKLEWLWIGQND